jgi:hypothetical protein
MVTVLLSAAQVAIRNIMQVNVALHMLPRNSCIPAESAEECAFQHEVSRHNEVHAAQWHEGSACMYNGERTAAEPSSRASLLPDKCSAGQKKGDNLSK